MPRTAAAFVLVLTPALLACSTAPPTSPSVSNPPTGPPGDSGSICRTYATAYTTVTTTPTGTDEASVRCAFDIGARAMTCTFSQSSALQACTLDSETRTTYVSAADWVNEPIGTTRAVQTIARSVSLSPSACPVTDGIGSTTNYFYDSVRRLLQVTTTSAEGPPVVTSYVFWDGRGRPTSGSTMVAGASTTVSYVYDDMRRSYLQLLTTPGAPTLTTIFTYDADGLLLRSTGESADGLVDTVFTTTGRAQVCQ